MIKIKPASKAPSNVISGDKKGSKATVLVVLLVLAILLALPAIALHRQQWDWRRVAGYLAFVNIL